MSVAWPGRTAAARMPWTRSRSGTLTSPRADGREPDEAEEDAENADTEDEEPASEGHEEEVKEARQSAKASFMAKVFFPIIGWQQPHPGPVRVRLLALELLGRCTERSTHDPSGGFGGAILLASVLAQHARRPRRLRPPDWVPKSFHHHRALGDVGAVPSLAGGRAPQSLPLPHSPTGSRNFPPGASSLSGSGGPPRWDQQSADWRSPTALGSPRPGV